jgi:hypothetical protein
MGHRVVDIVKMPRTSDTSQRGNITFVGGVVKRLRAVEMTPQHSYASVADGLHDAYTNHRTLPHITTSKHVRAADIMEGHTTIEVTPQTSHGSSVPQGRASREHATCHPRRHDTKLRHGSDVST